MRHRAAWATGLLLVGVLSFSCGRKEEEKLQVQIQNNINVLDLELQQLGRSRQRQESRVLKMKALLSQMETESVYKNARLMAADRSLLRLRELTTVGWGEPPALWVLRHPAFSPNVVLFLLLCLITIWLLYRVQQHRLQQDMLGEIDAVIARLKYAAEAEKKESAPSPPAAVGFSPGQKEEKEGAVAVFPSEKEKPFLPAESPSPSPPAPLAGEDETREEREAAPEKEEEPASLPPPKKPEDKEETEPETTVGVPVKPGGLQETPAEKEKPVAGEAAKGEKSSPPRRPARTKEPEKKAAAGGRAAAPAREKAREPAVSASAEKVAQALPRKKTAKRPVAKKCKVRGCKNKHRSKGFCNKHYQQWRKGILTEPLEEK